MRTHAASVAMFVLAALVALGGTALPGASAGAANVKPTATDVGVTATEIHIAVVADVDNPFAPGVFKPVVDSLNGFAKYVNQTGGIAGRKLVVDFYDSKLNASATRQSQIDACANDVAMVGTAAFFLTTVDDTRGCKDAQGKPTGLPDIPFLATAVPQQCSDQAYPITAPFVVCSTIEEHPQTFQTNVGVGYWYQKQYGKNLHGAYVFTNDTRSAYVVGFSTRGALRDVGITSDGDFLKSQRATQSEFSDVIQAMKSKSSNYGQCTGAFTCTVNLRKEAALQGLTGVKVWDCGVSCYDPQFLAAGGSDVDGEYVDMSVLPFFSKAEQKANPMLTNYVKYTGSSKVASYGAFAWASGLAFRQAVDAIVKQHGVNGVTRQNLFTALNQIHDFDAGGLIGSVDLAARTTTECHVTVQVRNGTFVRVNPKKPGTFDCSPRYVIHRQLDLLGS